MNSGFRVLPSESAGEAVLAINSKVRPVRGLKPGEGLIVIDKFASSHRLRQKSSLYSCDEIISLAQSHNVISSDWKITEYLELVGRQFVPYDNLKFWRAHNSTLQLIN